MPREEETTFMVDEEVDEGSSGAGGEVSAVSLEEKLGKTVVFFDYDDTLLPSSHLSTNGYSLDSTKEFSREMEGELRALESLVIKILEASLQLSEVYIVTNAETGWVQLSAKKFMPGLLPVLGKMTVISARSTYERMHPDNPLKWKYCAFQDALGSAYGSMDTVNRKNILSFGDSHVEREAVRAVTRGYDNVRMKSVKFQERPTMEQLRRQLLLVDRTFNYLCSHDGDLDLQLTVFPVDEPEREGASSSSGPAYDLDDGKHSAAVSGPSPSDPAIPDALPPAAAAAVGAVGAAPAGGGPVYHADFFLPPAQQQQQQAVVEDEELSGFHYDESKEHVALPAPMESALVMDG